MKRASSRSRLTVRMNHAVTGPVSVRSLPARSIYFRMMKFVSASASTQKATIGGLGKVIPAANSCWTSCPAGFPASGPTGFPKCQFPPSLKIARPCGVRPCRPSNGRSYPKDVGYSGNLARSNGVGLHHPFLKLSEICRAGPCGRAGICEGGAPTRDGPTKAIGLKQTIHAAKKFSGEAADQQSDLARRKRAVLIRRIAFAFLCEGFAYASHEPHQSSRMSPRSGESPSPPA